MMSDSFGRARIEIGADTTALKTDLERAGATTIPQAGKEMGKGLSDSFGSALNFKNLILAGLTGVTAAYFKGLADDIDKFAKDSQRLGIALQALSEISYVADLSGSSVNEMNAGIRVLSKNMAGAAGGATALQEAFQKAGIQYREAGVGLRNVNDVMDDLADKFASMPDSAEKTALAMELMGRSGTSLIPYLNEGKAGIKELKEEARTFGISLTKEFSNGVEQFNDNLTRVKAITTGVSYTIMDALVPSLNKAMDAFIDWYKEAAPSVLRSVRLGFKGIATSIDLMTGAASNSADSFSIIGKVAGTVALGISGAFNTVYFQITTSLALIAGTLETILKMSNRAAEAAGLGKVFSDIDIGAVHEFFKSMKSRSTDAYESLFKLGGKLTEIWKGPSKDQDAGRAVLNSLTPGFYGAEKGAKGFGDEVDKTKGKVVDLWTEIRLLNEEMMKTRYAGLEEGSAQSGSDWKYVTDTFMQDTLSQVAAGGMGASGSASFSDQLLALLGVGTGGYDTGMEVGAGDLGGAVPGMGAAIQNMVDVIAAIETAPMEDKLNYILDNFSFFGQTVRELSGVISDSIGGFFADAATQGLAASGKKLVAALLGVLGGILAKMGGAMIASGLAEIVIALSPFSMLMFPGANVAHGAKMMAVGGLLAAGGGLTKGLSSGIGGTAGAGGSGSTFQSNVARPYGSEVQPTVVDVNKPADQQSGTVNLTIQTVDAKSFGDFLKGGGDKQIADSVTRAVRGNSRLREGLRYGLS